MAMAAGRTTQSPSTLAQQTLDEEERKKKEKQAKQKAGKKKGDVTGQKGKTIGGGAAAGATVGMAAGPIGALIGAGVGAAAGAVASNQQEKKAGAGSDPNRPERRRISTAMGIAQERKQSKERALATLSQAVFDWAASIR